MLYAKWQYKHNTMPYSLRNRTTMGCVDSASAVVIDAGVFAALRLQSGSEPMDPATGSRTQLKQSFSGRGGSLVNNPIMYGRSHAPMNLPEAGARMRG
jgi:hypothetical protein